MPAVLGARGAFLAARARTLRDRPTCGAHVAIAVGLALAGTAAAVLGMTRI